MMQGWQSMITDHDSDKAVEFYYKASKLVQVEQLKKMFDQSLAWCHFIREDWKDVERLLKEQLEESESESAYSRFNLAVALYQLGLKDECAEWMKKIVKGEKKGNTDNWDSYAVNVAKSYLKENEFDRCALLLLLSENCNEAGR